jgi:hypothetical protein
MSVHHERLVELCGELRLNGIAAQYPALAQQAAERQLAFSDFLEALLVAERAGRGRARCSRGWPAFPPSRRSTSMISLSPAGRRANRSWS